MNWKAWFARDAVVWDVLFYVGIVATALSAVTDPSVYGIPASWMPYVRLIAFVFAVVGGKMGLSFAPKKADLT